jgi:phosphatidylserine decarboxylase
MSALIQALRLVPKNALSRAVGAALRAPWPKPMVQAGIQGFSKVYGVETGEAERDLADYRTFNDFFTRRLKPGMRTVDPTFDLAVCPVDGTVGQAGPIQRDTLVQAKGRQFTLGEFLVDTEDAADYLDGTFATLYLAPYNYHRIHTPFAGEVTGYSYVPGHLWPVNAKGVEEIDKLFAVNERLITHLSTSAGRMAIVKVGATCVGRIRATYDDVVTNDGSTPSFRRVRYDRPVAVEKAGECGIFEMGSTVVLLFQKGRAELDSAIVPGTVIRMGQPLAKLNVDGR